MTAQQARDIAAAYKNPRVQPWYLQLMEHIATEAKNQETKIYIRWSKEADKEFIASEGYIVGKDFVSWADPATEHEQPREEEPDLHWQHFIRNRIDEAAGCGYTEYWNRGLLTDAQKAFLERLGYRVSVGETPEIGTMISWDSNTPSP